jgi:hypothetical protein
MNTSHTSAIARPSICPQAEQPRFSLEKGKIMRAPLDCQASRAERMNAPFELRFEQEEE